MVIVVDIKLWKKVEVVQRKGKKWENQATSWVMGRCAELNTRSLQNSNRSLNSFIVNCLSCLVQQNGSRHRPACGFFSI